MGEKVRGNLMIIGGNEDKKGKKTILQKLVELSGGKDANILVCTVASADQASVGELYTKLFHELGAGRVGVLHIHNRLETRRVRLEDWYGKISGVFFTGGDQLRITSTLGGTELARRLYEEYLNGAVIAGTSAGAAAMGDIMIVGGEGTESPRIDEVFLAPGMGFLEEVVIDQHFTQRGRIARLLSVLARNPFVLGMGIDEDTAVIVHSDGEMIIIGSGSVTILDAAAATSTNASEVYPADTLALTDVKLHVLPVGYRFSLSQRSVLFPQEYGGGPEAKGANGCKS